MSSTLQLKRGTRKQLDSLAMRRGLLTGEPLLITDEARLAIATSPSTYEAMSKQSEGIDHLPKWSMLFLNMGA